MKTEPYNNSDLLPMLVAIHDRLRDMDDFSYKLISVDISNGMEDGGLFDKFCSVYSYRDNYNSGYGNMGTETALDVIFQIADVLNVCDELEALTEGAKK